MYAKHGNLVDVDAFGAKASTKHPESRLAVIQGQASRQGTTRLRFDFSTL